jgi:hypothetical protein
VKWTAFVERIRFVAPAFVAVYAFCDRSSHVVILLPLSVKLLLEFASSHRAILAMLLGENGAPTVFVARAGE